MTASIDLNKVVQAFNAIRDARTAKRHAYEQADADLEADQHKLKVIMLGILNNIGGQSIRTDAGTVFRSEKLKPSVADWNVVYAWIMADPERFELLEKRVKPTFVKSFMDENEGAIPPGVNVHREYDVSVRRPSA